MPQARLLPGATRSAATPERGRAGLAGLAAAAAKDLAPARLLISLASLGVAPAAAVTPPGHESCPCRAVRHEGKVGASGTARVGDPGLLAGLARAAVLTFAVLIALDQLNIGEAIVTTLFTAAVGMLALAGALAFGLGGREVAARVLEDWYRRRGGLADAADRLAVAARDEARPPATGRAARDAPRGLFTPRGVSSGAADGVPSVSGGPPAPRGTAPP